ncbi:MAG: GTPase domain-containing protein [archaeon]|nr:GTPase domain-containing protein [archaeon]
MESNNDFPMPNPDRRSKKLSNENNSSNKNESEFNIEFNSEKNPFISAQSNINKSQKESIENIPKSKEELENNTSLSFIKENNMSLVKKKHIQDMINKIKKYKLLNDKAMYLSSPNKYNLNKCNIILFGPSGSGKSSFIRSLYKALFNTKVLPPEIIKKLIIKGSDENEGTVCFTKFILQEESLLYSGIILFDTRGQILMNDKEKEQFKILIDGKVKEGVKVEQREERNPFALWEFWKKDTELFPKEILNSEESGIESIPHCIVLVFDGSKDEVIEREDEPFYSELVTISRRKGYTNIHAILTRIDLFEKKESIKNKDLPLNERNIKINTLKDEKIEEVIFIL